MDIYEIDRQRILGIKRGAEIIERVQQDAQLKAAIALELEARAEQQRQAEARQAEAAAIASAEVQAVEKLRALQLLYTQRQAAARLAIESLAALWSVEQQIRAGLNGADRALANVEVLIEPTQRGAWRSALRERAGLQIRHVFMAPREWVTTDAQRVGAVAVAGITSSAIGPGFIQTAHDVINFEF